jgi:hypothetical protein
MPSIPDVDDVLTIDPPPASRIARTTALIPRKHPTWLTRMTVM